MTKRKTSKSTTTVTKEEIAKLLTGRKIGEEITVSEIKKAAGNNLVVCYGYSDDSVIVKGAAFSDDRTTLLFTKEGVLDECTCHCKYYAAAAKKAKEVMGIFGAGKYPWMFKTSIPHATFNIYEEDDIFCQGIVFSLDDL